MAPARRTRTGFLFVASAVLIALLAASQTQTCTFSLTPHYVRETWRLSRSQVELGKLARRSDGGVETSSAPPLANAPVYMTPVDQLSGELDLSGLPQEMGVYAVYDEGSRLQYIGLSKDISKSVARHADNFGILEAGRKIAEVKCAEMPGQSKDVLKETWQVWIKEHIEAGGELPVGNLPDSDKAAERRWRTTVSASRPPLTLGGVSGIVSMNEALEAVKKAVKAHPVILFMKGTPVMPQCGFSARTVGLMSSIGVPFESVNVMDGEANTGVREAVKEFSNWPTIPQLFVNGELVGGADIIQEMHTAGELQKLLKDAAAGKQAVPAGSSQEASSSSAAMGDAGSVNLINDPGRPTATKLCSLLDQNFQLMNLQVIDDSASHAGDAGALEMGLTSESHFTVEITAPEFDGLSRVQRQKKVFDALSDVMPKIHAISLVTRSPTE
eukprot:TRINITY_DN40293_c0_g1_i1.p1 TRINITY_DN40293_c0_g1~~TRINITY_DN40293_c0_g1_i1.p1  ORF type:complete len:442 (-),score=104.85 TRINITY_DN40293_c0_g1_i1:41-1366(-)